MTVALATAVGVGLAGGLASVLRFVLDSRWPARPSGSALQRQPWGLWVANLVGSFLIGVSVSASAGPLKTVVATGVAGGLTTWSSWIVSAHGRWTQARKTHDGRAQWAQAEGAQALHAEAARAARRGVALQIAGQAIGGCAAVFAGILLGASLLPG